MVGVYRMKQNAAEWCGAILLRGWMVMGVVMVVLVVYCAPAGSAGRMVQRTS